MILASTRNSIFKKNKVFLKVFYTVRFTDLKDGLVFHSCNALYMLIIYQHLVFALIYTVFQLILSPKKTDSYV